MQGPGPDIPENGKAGASDGRAKRGAAAPAFRILGIDPGLASVGWGLVEARRGRLACLAYGCITTDKDDPIGDRLLAISTEVSGLIEEWKPAEGAMESLYFWKNVTSALPVAEAKGVIRLAFASRSIGLGEFSPTAIKQAVSGSARADKGQVQEMVRLLLGLKDVPRPDHAADALAAAICRAHNSGPLAAGSTGGRA